MRAIVSADARSRKSGFELKIVRGPEPVQKLLYLAGLDKILPLIDAERFRSSASGTPASRSLRKDKNRQ